MPLCPQCNQEMQVTVKPTDVGAVWVKIEECKQHGRIFSRIYEAARGNARDLLECARCHDKCGTLYANGDWGMICPQCHAEKADNDSVGFHMQSILCE